MGKHFDVVPVEFATNPFGLTAAVLKCDVIFCWFADIHSVSAVTLARILGKPSIVVSGGYDVANLPEIEYGAFAGSFPTRIAAKHALRKADRVLVVDPSLAVEAIAHARYDGRNIRYLPTGYDPQLWTPGPEGVREPIVITVSEVSKRTLKLKGIDTFAATAKLVPEASFVVVGELKTDWTNVEEMRGISNLTCVGRLETEELRETYHRASVYCQLSLHEGLPNALCEAMLCGCVPIGTRAGGIERAIGDTGFVVPFGNANATATAIRAALSAPISRRGEARSRISSQFSPSRRAEGLLSVIAEVTGTAG